jgi:site-specific DNA recombinase
LKRDEIDLKQGMSNQDKKVDDCLEFLLNMDKYYVSKSTETKQRIVGSIFPKKLIFDGNNYRTPILNKAVALICRNANAFEEDKKGKLTIFDELSGRVESGGFEPPSKQGIKVLSTFLYFF